MNIHAFADKIKGQMGERSHTLIYMGILVAVALASFYLGYIGRAETAKASPVVIMCPLEAYMSSQSLGNGVGNGTLAPETSLKTKDIPGSPQGAFVASKNGSKYYPLDCSGADRIKPENKVYFNSERAAQAAGYSLAATCQ